MLKKLFSVFSASPADPPAPQRPKAQLPPAPTPPALTAAQNGFGLALLRQMAGQAPGANVFLSPFSVATALGLVLEGAAGPTRAALRHTLNLPPDELPDAELAAAVEAQLRALTSTAEDEPVFTLANALWADKSFMLAPAYVARVRQHYKAEAASLDFAAADATATINAWVSRHTRGKITEVVAGQPSPPLLLANACYFKGRWAAEFSPHLTKPGLFTLADGSPRPVPLMQLRTPRFGYQAGPGHQAVRLPYEGYQRSFSMQLFVPDEPAGLPDFLATLTAESWARWQAAFATQESLQVDLTMPRFRLEWAQDLGPSLRALGLGPALAAGADFTPMGFAPAEGGFIESVVHKTYLAVDEVGTEAAAVTAVWMAGSAAPPVPPRVVTVRADHPFFCAIVDDATGALLFGGAVYEPLAGAGDATLLHEPA